MISAEVREPVCRAARDAVVVGVCRLLGVVEPLLPDLVEAGGQPLREPAGVGEDERRAVLRDEVDDPLLDMRPDGRPPLRAGRRAGQVVLDDLAEGGHVGDRDHDVEVLLGRRGRTASTSRPREVARLVDRLDRRGQADALRRRLEQRVEPLERQGEMGAAFRAGHGVDLVEDDGLDAGERLARGRGEDEEQ